MEFQTINAKLATDHVDKLFGDKEPELKAIMQMEMALDTDDPDDMEKKTIFWLN